MSEIEANKPIVIPKWHPKDDLEYLPQVARF